MLPVVANNIAQFWSGVGKILLYVFQYCLTFFSQFNIPKEMMPTLGKIMRLPESETPVLPAQVRSFLLCPLDDQLLTVTQICTCILPVRWPLVAVTTESLRWV